MVFPVFQKGVRFEPPLAKLFPQDQKSLGLHSLGKKTVLIQKLSIRGFLGKRLAFFDMD